MSIRKLKLLCESVNEDVSDDNIQLAVTELKKRANNWKDIVDLEVELKNKYGLSDRHWAQVLQKYEYDT